ncbi:unnamed protein product [Polarella glacialis]|uniref:Uncharacterized protein n=1 Tax=Polarella glacialis TaxID=89957 RepID=A0A813H6I6_POLGL|nr:unnamed protein product [Polarella glacialis]CAE8659033.1 unnamed protein product [Polarella glacialis]
MYLVLGRPASVFGSQQVSNYAKLPAASTRLPLEGLKPRQLDRPHPLPLDGPLGSMEDPSWGSSFFRNGVASACAPFAAATQNEDLYCKSDPRSSLAHYSLCSHNFETSACSPLAAANQQELHCKSDPRTAPASCSFCSLKFEADFLFTGVEQKEQHQRQCRASPRFAPASCSFCNREFVSDVLGTGAEWAQQHELTCSFNPRFAPEECSFCDGEFVAYFLSTGAEQKREHELQCRKNPGLAPGLLQLLSA